VATVLVRHIVSKKMLSVSVKLFAKTLHFLLLSPLMNRLEFSLVETWHPTLEVTPALKGYSSDL